MPGRPNNVVSIRTRVYCAFNKHGWGLFGLFLSRKPYLFSFTLSFGDGSMKTEIFSQSTCKPKQPTNHRNES